MTDRLSKSMHSALLAFGSNVGDREDNIRKALELIREIPETQVLEVSPFREFTAEGVSGPQPAFLNGVLRLETELLPLELLEKLQIIERRLGRTTKGDGAPRAIDLDILSYGSDVIISGKTLSIPHPRLHERRFVLEPLAEIAPDWVHPKLKRTARELLAGLAGCESSPNPSN